MNDDNREKSTIPYAAAFAFIVMIAAYLIPLIINTVFPGIAAGFLFYYVTVWLPIVSVTAPLIFAYLTNRMSVTIFVFSVMLLPYIILPGVGSVFMYLVYVVLAVIFAFVGRFLKELKLEKSR